MKMTSGDKKSAEPKVMRAECFCGLELELRFDVGPGCVHWTCPDLNCGSVFDLRYVGRKRRPRPVMPLENECADVRCN